jgi:hypothetical protein
VYIVSTIIVDHRYDSTETMLIPKVTGDFKEGFKRTFKYLRQLPIGHRCRGDVRI